MKKTDISLRRPGPKAPQLGKVFNRAVKGYKILKRAEQGRTIQISARQVYMPPVQVVAAAQPVAPPAPPPVSIPLAPTTLQVPRRAPEVDLSSIDISYPLIPRQPAAGVAPSASANIKWSATDAALVYHVIEPELSTAEKELLEKIKSALIEKLDIDFTTLRRTEAKDYLRKHFEDMVGLMAADMPAEKRSAFLYFIERDFIGLGKIEPLMQDPDIEDLSVDGVSVPVYVYHRNPLIASVKTNIVFETPEELDTFVNKLAQRCGKSISVANPLLGAALPDGSRIQATLATDIARRGSNFSIRKFTEVPFTPTHMIKFKTMDSDIAAYIWTAIEYGRSILVSGGVATGKTSFLNAISLFIRPELRIVSIEDTAELRLPHEHWMPQVARTPVAEADRRTGEVDLFDLLRESLRQRPDYLILGEVRGRETFVLFQQIATGHASIATIHADTMERLIDRLTTPPISLPAALIEALDIIVFLVRIKYGPAYVRRISNIFEIIGFDHEHNMPMTNEVFRWDPATDRYVAVNPSIMLKKIAGQYGILETTLQHDISQRSRVLKWMVDQDIADYRDVARIIRIYYTKPEEVLSAI